MEHVTVMVEFAQLLRADIFEEQNRDGAAACPDCFGPDYQRCPWG
jgi:hypothetical protein